jgi:hypothetical protein
VVQLDSDRRCLDDGGSVGIADRASHCPSAFHACRMSGPPIDGSRRGAIRYQVVAAEIRVPKEKTCGASVERPRWRPLS